MFSKSLGFTSVVLALIIVSTVWYVFQENKKMIKIGGAYIEVEIADSLPEQILGLSGRARLCETCGMLFVYKGPQMMNFWMKDMRFPLDIIFLKDQRITEMHQGILPPKRGEAPQRVLSQGPADTVLEVNAGFAQKNRLKIGDYLDLKEN